MQREEDLLVVRTGVVPGFDIEAAKLSGIGCAFQIVPRRSMGVIPTEPGRPGRKLVTELCSGSDHRPTFFGRAIHGRGNPEAVPVHDFRDRGPVLNIDNDWFALPPAD